MGYYHLAAYSPRGYAENASYALFWASAERLRGRDRWLISGPEPEPPATERTA